MLASVERLTDFPSSDRSVSELDDPGIREILFGSYRIIYRVKEEAVEILTLYHVARLLDPSRIDRLTDSDQMVPTVPTTLLADGFFDCADGVHVHPHMHKVEAQDLFDAAHGKAGHQVKGLVRIEFTRDQTLCDFWG